MKLDNNYSVKTLHRAIQVLKVFSRERTVLSMTEINELTQISKPSLQRILSTLVYEGFLIRDEDTKKYGLGLELYLLGNLVQKDSHLLTVAMPIMEEIRSKTKEAIILSINYRDLRYVIGNLNSNHVLTANSFVGYTSPLYVGASGKTLLAFQTDQEISDYFFRTKLDKVTSNTTTDIETIKEELIKIRKNGYAYSSGERLKGVSSITTPIFNRFSEVIAALSIMIPTTREVDYDREELVNIMKESANEITNELGKGKISSSEI